MTKSIIVSGATGNLGAAVVQKLTESGMRLSLVVSKRNPSEFAHLENTSSQVIDLMDQAATESFVTQVFEKEKEVHAAVLLVGAFAMGTIKSTSDEDIQKMININFLTAFHMVRPLLEHFERQGFGQIILVGSKAALNPAEGAQTFAYTLSKKMLLNLAEMINAQGTSIKASVIVPGTLDTPVNRAAMPNADFSKWVSPRNVAENIDFLLSNAGNQLREPVLKIYNNS